MLIVRNSAPQKLDVAAIELEMVTATFEALLTAMNNKDEYVFDPLAFNIPVNALVKTSKEISALVEKLFEEVGAN